MEDFLKILAAAIVTALGTGGLIAVFLALNPNAVERWTAIVAKILYRAFGLAHRRYVQFDLQAKVNDFTARLVKEVPSVADTRCSVQWSSAQNVTRDAFLKDGQVIVRLRKDDRREENFIHGAYLYVSIGLLHGVKRYLSQTQRESIDLFVTLKLMEREKAHLRAIFLDEYVHPRAAKSENLGPLLESSEVIDRAGLYFPLLIQELHFLGDKVFGRTQNDRIISEVTALIEYLGKIAIRRTGDENELDFSRDYCKVAIVIVGKSAKITEGGRVWTGYIQRDLAPKGIETIYLLGAHRNADVIREIAQSLATSYESYREHHYNALIHDVLGAEFMSEQHLIVLRKIGARAIQPPPRGV